MSKAVPKLRFKVFKEPSSNSKIDSIAEFRSGGTPSMDNPNYWNGSIPWISAASMLGKYYSKSDRMITELGLSNGSKLAKKGSLLLLTRGSMLFNKIPIGIAEVDVAFNQDVKNLIVNNHSTSEFIYQWVQSKEQLLMNKVVGTGIGAGKLETSELKNLSIFLPSLPEQQKIASFLSAVDEKIRQLTRKKELLEQYKKGVMQQLFSGKLRFKDENGKAYPKWEEKLLGDLIEIGSSKRVLQEDWKEEGIPFFRTREIISLATGEEFRTPIFITEELYSELKLKYGVPKIGDILATGVGTIGEVYVVQNSEKFYFKDGNVIWFKMSDRLDSIYLSQLFKSRYIRKQLLDNASITTVATFTIDGAKKTRIIFPCKEEQQKIASFLTALDTKIENLATQIAHTQTFKKGLLQQMFV